MLTPDLILVVGSQRQGRDRAVPAELFRGPAWQARLAAATRRAAAVHCLVGVVSRRYGIVCLDDQLGPHASVGWPDHRSGAFQAWARQCRKGLALLVERQGAILPACLRVEVYGPRQATELLARVGLGDESTRLVHVEG